MPTDREGGAPEKGKPELRRENAKLHAQVRGLTAQVEAFLGIKGGAPEKEPEPLCDCGHRMSSHGPMGCWVDRDNDVFCACTVDPERQAGQGAGEPERADELAARDGVDAAVVWLRELAVAATKQDATFGARLMVVADEMQAFAERVLPRGAAPSAPEGEIERLREALRTLIGEAQYYVKDDQGYTITSLSEAIADARAALEGR